MAPLSRRSFLWHGTVALSAIPWLEALLAGPRGRDLLTFALELRDGPLDAGLRRIVELHGQGWTITELLAGIYVAGAIAIEPTLGGYAHCAMVVPSALALAEASDPEEALSAVLFNYSNFKNFQSRVDSFRLPPAPSTSLDPTPAAGALESALFAWDAEAADRAAVAAARANDVDPLFEHLWQPGVRDFNSSIGHKIIATAQSYRLLARVGFTIAEPVLRWLALGLLRGRELGTEDFDANRERAATLDEDWSRAAEDPAASRDLLDALRTASAKEAPEVVVEMIRKGIGPGTLWDGMRLAAAEINIRSPGLLAVHALTSVNAMSFASRTTKRDETRRLMLLTAATWTVLYREFTSGSVRPLRIDGVEATERQSAAQLFARGDGEDALACALATTSTPAGRKEFLDSACRQVVRKADEPHYYKYAAAVREEVEKIHPTWAPHLLAASLSYLPREADTPVYRKWRNGEYQTGR